MKRFVIIAALLAGAVMPRGAAGEQPSLAVQVARMATTEESWHKMVKNISDQTAQFIESSVRREGGTIPPDFGARFAEEFQMLLTYQETLDLTAGLLAKYFTDPELRQLIAFYKTPVGQKSIRNMPELAADVNGQMMALMQQRMPAMMERLKSTLEPAGRGGAAKTPPAAPAPAKSAK